MQPAKLLLADAAFEITGGKKISQTSTGHGRTMHPSGAGAFIRAFLAPGFEQDGSETGTGERVVKVLDLMARDDLLALRWHATVRNAQPSYLENDEGNIPFQQLRSLSHTSSSLSRFTARKSLAARSFGWHWLVVALSCALKMRMGSTLSFSFSFVMNI